MKTLCCPVCRAELSATEYQMACSAGHEFPVIDGIPILLADLDAVSREVREFYEQNWSNGTAKKLHEDVSDIGQRYITENERRAVEVTEGEYFLDVGCGAQPRVEFGAKHKFHVCMDMSLAGIMEARNILGTRGIYVVGSILQSPLKPEVFDNAMASHCIYHIDALKQPEAVENILASVKAQGVLTVLYSNPDSLEKKLVSLIPRKKRGEIYFHPLSVKELTAGVKAKVHGLRLFSQTVSRPLFKLFGNIAFQVLTRLERRFTLASISTYVVVIISK